MTIPGKVFVPWRGYLAYALIFGQLVAVVALTPNSWPWWLAGLVWLAWIPTSLLFANMICRPYQPVQGRES